VPFSTQTRPRSRVRRKSSPSAKVGIAFANHYRLHDAFYPWIAQALRVAVQVNRTFLYQEFPCRFYLFGAHRFTLGAKLPFALFAQGVDQPGLTLGKVINQGHSLITENLSCLGRMLAHQGLNVLSGKGTQGCRIFLDVERTTRVQGRSLHAADEAVAKVTAWLCALMVYIQFCRKVVLPVCRGAGRTQDSFDSIYRSSWARTSRASGGNMCDRTDCRARWY